MEYTPYYAVTGSRSPLLSITAGAASLDRCCRENWASSLACPFFLSNPIAWASIIRHWIDPPLPRLFDSTDYASSYSRMLVINLTNPLHYLPVESNYTTILCWPLAVLGGYAEEFQRRDIILRYLSGMAEKYRQENVYQTIKLSGLIWNSPHFR